MYYSEQFYPTTSFKARDIYEQFYRSASSFSGLRLINDLGILLDMNRVNGTLTMENGSASIIVPDIGTYNGVIHRLDRVLPLPEDIVSVLTDLPTVLASAGNFSILTQLINQAGGSFADTLRTGGPFTVLAPTGKKEEAMTLPQAPSDIYVILSLPWKTRLLSLRSIVDGFLPCRSCF